MEKLLACLFVVVFFFTAIGNPAWALWAYPTIGLMIWFSASMLGKKLPFSAVLLWLPRLIKSLATEA